MAASRLLQGCSAVNRRLTSGAPRPPPPREVLPLPQVPRGFSSGVWGSCVPAAGIWGRFSRQDLVFHVKMWQLGGSRPPPGCVGRDGACSHQGCAFSGSCVELSPAWPQVGGNPVGFIPSHSLPWTCSA